VRQCNSCHGRGGMTVDENFQIDWECCLECDGYGYIYDRETTDDD
jgi:DnaJ-class molecular chaperone